MNAPDGTHELNSMLWNKLTDLSDRYGTEVISSGAPDNTVKVTMDGTDLYVLVSFDPEYDDCLLYSGYTPDGEYETPCFYDCFILENETPDSIADSIDMLFTGRTF